MNYKKFTLIEFIVVIVIVMLLLGMLIPVLSKARQRAAARKNQPIELKYVASYKYKNHIYLRMDGTMIHDPDCEYCKKNGDF